MFICIFLICERNWLKQPFHVLKKEHTFYENATLNSRNNRREREFSCLPFLGSEKSM